MIGPCAARRAWPFFRRGPAEQKRVRELLAQRRELLKQMQAG